MLFVHHYISAMHELGHTTVRHGPSPANGGRNGDPTNDDVNVNCGADSSADSSGQNRGEGEMGIQGPRLSNTAGLGETSGNVNCNGSLETRDNEGVGGDPHPSAKVVVEGSAGTQEQRKRMHSSEQHSGSSRRTSATDVSVFS